jgi:hypothetical protein
LVGYRLFLKLVFVQFFINETWKGVGFKNIFQVYLFLLGMGAALCIVFDCSFLTLWLLMFFCVKIAFT